MINLQTGKVTCNENCMEASEEECNCSCGGQNHGILLQEGRQAELGWEDGFREALAA